MAIYFVVEEPSEGRDSHVAYASQRASVLAKANPGKSYLVVKAIERVRFAGVETEFLDDEPGGVE